MNNIAVIGAGLAGLSCAEALRASGHQPVVFEKSRGPGGRMSTRRGDHWQADLGAQYFTAQDPDFLAAVRGWQQQGLVDVWPQGMAQFSLQGATMLHEQPLRYVAKPGMSAITRHLAAKLSVHYGVRVHRLHGGEPRWTLQDSEGERHGPFDRLVLALPAPQAATLLEASAIPVPEALETVTLKPCWTAVLKLPGFEPDWQAAFIDHPLLQSLSWDGAKAGRQQPDIWVLHADADWSQDHLEDGPETAGAAMLAALSSFPGLPQATLLHMHRWRYAKVVSAIGDTFDTASLMAAAGLGLCGDWCLGGRLEAAWLSGRHMARCYGASVEPLTE